MDANDRGATFDNTSRFAGAATAEAPSKGPVHPAGHSGEGSDGTVPHAQSAADALFGVRQRLGELGEYASYLLSAKLDGYKVLARNLGIYAVLGVVGLVAGATVVITSVVLLLVGLAMAIGKAFDPDQFWVGAVIVGVAVLGGLAGAVIFGLKWLSSTSRTALVRKYEERQREQRAKFGRDVRGREADPA